MAQRKFPLLAHSVTDGQVRLDSDHVCLEMTLATGKKEAIQDVTTVLKEKQHGEYDSFVVYKPVALVSCLPAIVTVTNL